MQYRPLGQTGLKVSAVGLGAWQLNNALWGGADATESVHLVQTALDAGCNFIDTAPAYGDGASERLIGAALRGRRSSAVVCTKFGHSDPHTKDFSVAALRPMLEASLQRLQTDYVDVLLLHNPPAELLDQEQAAELHGGLEALRQEGKIRVFGASVDWRNELQALTTHSRSGAAEVLFNAFHQEPQAAFAGAAARGMGLIVKVPLDSGWLSGRYDEHSRFEGIRSRWTPAVIARRGALVAKLRALLPPGLPLAQGALRFVLAHPEVSTVIPGAKSCAQLEANLAAAAESLPPAVVTAIQALWVAEIAPDPLPW